MFKKGIARRWLFNSLGVMILLFTACIAALSFVVQSYAYNGIQMTLIGRSDELPTVLSGSMKTVSEFNAAARSYTENFPDKDLMEVMAVSRSGSILSTSSGFAPDQNQSKPDFESALHSDEGHFLAFFQALEAVALNSAEVYEQIRTAFWSDKTKTFLVVKPLDGTALTFSHFLISLTLKINDSPFRMKEYWAGLQESKRRRTGCSN